MIPIPHFIILLQLAIGAVQLSTIKCTTHANDFLGARLQRVRARLPFIPNMSYDSYASFVYELSCGVSSLTGWVDLFFSIFETHIEWHHLSGLFALCGFIFFWSSGCMGLGWDSGGFSAFAAFGRVFCVSVVGVGRGVESM